MLREVFSKLIFILWICIYAGTDVCYLEVSAMVINLRNMANDIRNTTQAQNETLARIDAKVNDDIFRTVQQDKVIARAGYYPD